MGMFSVAAMASTSQCYEFKWKSHQFRDRVEKRPTIITKRGQVNGETVIISQEVIPLNEDVYNTLYALKDGVTVCLKGTKGLFVGSAVRFYAFGAEAQGQ